MVRHDHTTTKPLLIICGLRTAAFIAQTLLVLPLPISFLVKMALYRQSQDSINALTVELTVSLKLSVRKKHLLIEPDRVRLFSKYLGLPSTSIKCLTLKLFMTVLPCVLRFCSS